MTETISDDAFFQPPGAVAAQALPHHKPVRVRLDPVNHPARDARAELTPLVQQQAQKMRAVLQQLEHETQKMRARLDQLEQPERRNRRAADGGNRREDGQPRRRASDRRAPEDPNQLYLFDAKFLEPQFAAPPATLPAAVDQSSVENFSISLAYGDDGFGLVGTTLVALAMSDSNGDGKIDHHDLFPDRTPVHGLNLDLNQLREGMMAKVRELVARFDTNGNGRIDGPAEAFAFLRHVAHLDLDVTEAHRDPVTGMITTESYIKAFGERLTRGLETPVTGEA